MQLKEFSANADNFSRSKSGDISIREWVYSRRAGPSSPKYYEHARESSTYKETSQKKSNNQRQQFLIELLESNNQKRTKTTTFVQPKRNEFVVGDNLNSSDFTAWHLKSVYGAHDFFEQEVVASPRNRVRVRSAARNQLAIYSLSPIRVAVGTPLTGPQKLSMFGGALVERKNSPGSALFWGGTQKLAEVPDVKPSRRNQSCFWGPLPPVASQVVNEVYRAPHADSLPSIELKAVDDGHRAVSSKLESCGENSRPASSNDALMAMSIKIVSHDELSPIFLKLKSFKDHLRISQETERRARDDLQQLVEKSLKSKSEATLNVAERQLHLSNEHSKLAVVVGSLKLPVVVTDEFTVAAPFTTDPRLLERQLKLKRRIMNSESRLATALAIEARVAQESEKMVHDAKTAAMVCTRETAAVLAQYEDEVFALHLRVRDAAAHRIQFWWIRRSRSNGDNY
jgi:hypothetical protein